MKMYTKPTVDVVELSVKETMAALPAAVSGSVATGTYTSGEVTYAATVYDLTATTTSTTQS